MQIQKELIKRYIYSNVKISNLPAYLSCDMAAETVTGRLAFIDYGTPYFSKFLRQQILSSDTTKNLRKSSRIKLHEEKLKKAEKESNIELAHYYKKEITSKKNDKEEKERLLRKGG